MKKLDTKGMTLIEMVMSILIITIASLIIVTALSTVTNIIADSHAHKTAADNQLSALVGKKESTAAIEYTDSKITISADGLKNPIEISGKKAVANSGEEIAIRLKNFEVEQGALNIYQDYYTDVVTLCDTILNMSNADRIAYYKEFNEEYKTSIGTDPGLSNDKFKIIIYYKLGFLELGDSIKEQCNVIFDKTHKESVPSWMWDKELGCRIGTNKKEILPYYIQKNGVAAKDSIFLYVSNKIGLVVDWNTALIYDADERCWYYKLFESGNGNVGAYHNIAYLATADLSWEQFKAEIQVTNDTKWSTIKIK